MTLENENPTNENNANQNKPNNTPPPAPREDAMSILERRLAEINARKTTSPANAGSVEPAAPIAPTAFAEALPPEPETPAAAPTNESATFISEKSPEKTEAAPITLPETMPATETSTPVAGETSKTNDPSEPEFTEAAPEVTPVSETTIN